MKMSDLILAVGDDNLKFQNLDSSAISFDYNVRNGTRITFGSDQPVNLNGTTDLGIVLWLPRDAVKAALDTEKSS